VPPTGRADHTHETDWGLPRDPGVGRRRAVAFVAVLVYAGVIGLFTGITLLIGGNPLPGIILITGLGMLDLATVGSQVLRKVDAQPVKEGTEPRLENLAAGLVKKMELRAPRLYVYDARGPNGFACRRRGPVVGISRPALSELNRTELEALIAHCLVRTHSPSLRLAPLACQARLFARALGPLVGAPEDVRASAVTRYPPALITVLGKSTPATGRYGPLYFTADHPSHVPVPDRIAALSDL
jgi:hypothetical protein